jgi:DNA polymerase-3 subunit epsilon
MQRIEVLAAHERYEDAAAVRSRLTVVLRSAVRLQRLSAFTVLTQLVAARPAASGGWELVVVRRGRLAAAGISPPGAHPRIMVETLLAMAETVLPGPGPTPAATAEESERILAWVERPETRLVRLDGSAGAGWASPARGAGRWRGLLARAESAAAARRDLPG